MIRSELVQVITAFALLTGVVTLLAVRSWRIALRLTLDLLTAASLVRLAGTQHWRELATAATIVLLRTVIGAILAGPQARAGSGSKAAPRPPEPPYPASAR
ncbi:hypothetical protein ACI2K4_03720 [Micromonospora sp. NPDC050397]|uniref:hypothetical protein n=1 Tax=Micromonospora sp. NPDC050397 TaxID=3364279 RepID=UPI003850C1B8